MSVSEHGSVGPAASPVAPASDIRSLQFDTRSGLRLAADLYGAHHSRRVLLLHGSGQTRHSWKGTAARLGHEGFQAVNLDLRGHGESGWALDGDYSIDAFLADIHDVLAQLPNLPTAVIGASLGGIVGCTYVAEGFSPAMDALVLVDIVPSVSMEGGSRVLGFMSSRLDGFGSVEEAAEAIAAYLPHRKRPPDFSSLAKNLRGRSDGRLHWHWDPAFLKYQVETDPELILGRMQRGLGHISAPTLLVAGGNSELVKPDGIRQFLDSMPGADFALIDQAAHMVAGDRNDQFSSAIVSFLSRKMMSAVSQ
jgi:non-heme chloroperoxidase